MRQLYFRFLEKGIQGIVTLNEVNAPKTCSAIWGALAAPVRIQAMHAMFAGPEVMLGLRPSAQTFDPRARRRRSATIGLEVVANCGGIGFGDGR